MDDLELAKKKLNETGCTFAAAKDGQVIASTTRGIMPVLELFDADDVSVEKGLAGWSVADKVVGKAPAMLYSILKPEEVYAHVMTKTAMTVLKQAGIRYSYDISADRILRRDGQDICPMEKAVKDIDDPEAAYSVLKEAAHDLMNSAVHIND